jgi:hypothetical protein
MPTRDGKQKQTWGQLEVRSAEGSWQPAGARESVPYAGTGPTYGALMLDTSPNKRGYLVYMDDFRFEEVAEVSGALTPAPAP